SSLPTALAVPLGLLIFELVGYAYHRAAHAVPLLWRLHAVHHSAPQMDWLASFRQHPLEIVLMTLIQNLPLVLLGIPLGEHALIVLLLAINTVFVHANLRVGRPGGILCKLVATPAFHHRHHDAEGPARNFASLLPVLDRLFGTHSEERARSFGLAGGVGARRGFVALMLTRVGDAHRP
ncbi:MAG: sterol desaturase family protein, partial [Myxococcales bacterium]|nr:sterol desaturase family protein [Myxococcales bacterium]